MLPVCSFTFNRERTFVLTSTITFNTIDHLYFASNVCVLVV